MNFYEEYNRYSMELREAISESMKQDIRDFAEMHRKHTEFLSERAKVALKTLGYYGWYIPSLDHP